MSQISTVFPSESSYQGQGAARPSAKGHAAGHPLFAGLLEQAGLGLQADPGGVPLNPAVAPGADPATGAGDGHLHDDEPTLLDGSLLGLPSTPLQDPAPSPEAAAQSDPPAAQDHAFLEALPAPSEAPTEALSRATPAAQTTPPGPPSGLSIDPPPAWAQAAMPTPGTAQATTTAGPDTTAETDGLTPTPSTRPPQAEAASARVEEPPPSTVSRARHSAVSIAAQQHAQATSMARLDLQGWNTAPQGLPASAPLQASAAALNAAPLAEASVSPGLGGGAADNGPQSQEPGPFQRQAGEPAGRVETPGLATGTPAADAAAPKGFALGLGRAMGDAFDHLGTQISVWASQNMKRASLSLDAGLGKALDVDVSLQDGQAHLAFRTDDAAARAALQSHAQQVMADLLARNGMGLAGLSIGARGQEGQPGQDGGRGTGQRATRGIGAGAVASETATVQWVARPGRALDVYA